jgi:hypothetical protein
METGGLGKTPIESWKLEGEMKKNFSVIENLLKNRIDCLINYE